MIDISVIIVNWNTKDLLQQCLTSLFRQIQPCLDVNVVCEVWVVDNGSFDGSPEMVEQKFPPVNLIRNQENLGFSKANNQAILKTLGRYILLLNSDTEINTHVFQELLAFMDHHPSVGVAGTKLLNPDGSHQYSCDVFPRRPLMLLRDKLMDSFFRHNETRWHERMATWNFNKNFAVDYVIGAALLIRRDTYEQIGVLDEQFFMYAEDIDWCYRAALAGWKTYYLGKISIYHHNRASSEKSPELSFRLQALRTKSLLKFYRKHYGVVAALILHLIILLKDCLRKKP